METTILIAKVLGVYFAVSGVFIITNKKTFALIIADIFKHRAVSFILGIRLVFGGSVLVLRENTGQNPISLFVLFASWAILLKGVAYMFFPDSLNSFAKSIPKAAYTGLGAVIAVLGLYLLFYI